MEHPFNLFNNFQHLTSELEKLKALGVDVTAEAKPENNGWIWMQLVEEKEREVAELHKAVIKIPTSFSREIDARYKINKRVIKCISTVHNLKTRKDEIVKAMANASSESMASLLIKLAREDIKVYSRVELIKSTNNFSARLGSGGFGDVYKGVLYNGVQIAVKVLKKTANINENQFKAEAGSIYKICHKNLVELRGFCYDADIKALVYEYMENGSLADILSKNHLDMIKLYDIAIEVAEGISYLHESCDPHIIHHDIKPANVLVDVEFCPKVTDFGLAIFNTGTNSQVTGTSIRGTKGYIAPEICKEKEAITYKCDVYSFGMILFDILGSKRNCASQKWLPGQVWEMYKENQLDKFIEDSGIKAEDKQTAKILATVALLCAEDNPEDRPSMSTVVKMLQGKMDTCSPVNPFPLYDSSSDSSMSRDSRI